MRFKSYHIQLTAVFCILLFFSCTSNIELPPHPDSFVEPGDSSSSLAYNSSSSGGSSSSVDGSSSSNVSSSNSIPAPQVTGSFEFTDFDYSSSSSKIYFLRTDISSKLSNTLEIINADAAECGDIAVEITGGGLNAAWVVEEPGEIIAYAVATCDGKKDTLKTTKATVVPDPTFSECTLPSTYVYKNEPIKNLVTVVDNNYGRCADVTYNPDTYPNPTYSSPASATAQDFITTVSCGSTTKICSWSKGITVANYYVDFLKEDVHYKITNSGSTVIKMPITNPLQNRLGCEYTSPPGGTSNIVFTLTVNGNKVNSVGSQPYWTNSSTFDPSYTTNGDRILFETQNSGLECATTRE
jgi:hypothetical protein